MQIRFKPGWLLVAVLLVGCTGTTNKISISQPQIQTIATEAFEARIMPIKLDNPFFVAFQLDVRNITKRPLAIDWNKTRYVHNGKDHGIFVFRGIDPESVRSGIPETVVSGGQVFSRQISPIKTLGFLRKRDVPKPGQSNFFPGILPDGDNSVVLFVRQDERRWQETLTVRLVSK